MYTFACVVLALCVAAFYVAFFAHAAWVFWPAFAVAAIATVVGELTHPD
jgi:hypothetical protein